jgi:tRNA(Ile2) C34 agmatinyltransferase TiaS
MPTKATKLTKAIKDARESNRLRQQRFLENHRDEINEKRRERYAERKESGRCPRCGKKLRSQKRTLCKDCLEQARVYNQR